MMYLGLLNAIHGAYYVHVDMETYVIYCWFGGTVFISYDTDGEALEHWNHGCSDSREAGRLIREHIEEKKKEED